MHAQVEKQWEQAGVCRCAVAAAKPGVRAAVSPLASQPGSCHYLIV